MSYSTFQSIYLKHKWVIYVDRGSQKTWLNVTSGIITMCNTVIFICSQFYKVLGQKFSLYREGSSLFKFNFVPSFCEEQNIIYRLLIGCPGFCHYVGWILHTFEIKLISRLIKRGNQALILIFTILDFSAQKIYCINTVHQDSELFCY